MMQRTSINWCLGPDGAQGFSWNCFAGCSPNKPSPGCAKCWAERLAATRLAHLPAYDGLTSDKGLWSGRPGCTPGWTGEVRFFPEKLAEPLRRKKPSGIAVGLMGDIALLPFEQIAAIFGVMAACQQHRFYILSKRPERLQEWFEWVRCRGVTEAIPPWLAVQQMADEHVDLPSGSIPFPERPWPLPNAFVGASASTQADLDRVAPELLRIPAAVRFISYEPALEALTVPEEQLLGWHIEPRHNPRCDGSCSVGCPEPYQIENPRIDWVIAGGESGPNARPCHVDWLRSIVRQCRDAGTACFIKQLGSRACKETPLTNPMGIVEWMGLRDRSGSDMSEWPEYLRVREMPDVKP